VPSTVANGRRWSHRQRLWPGITRSPNDRETYFQTDCAASQLRLDSFVLRTPGTSAQLLMGQPTLPYGDNDFRVVRMKLADEGMTAAADVQLSIVDHPPLGAFFTRLADAWRGWDGIRTWRATERQLELDAPHDVRGHVTLGVTLKSWRATQSVDVWLSALGSARRRYVGCGGATASIASSYRPGGRRCAAVAACMGSGDGARRASACHRHLP
jgi:Family of unknown function (DUF6228)